jgi:two-component system, OmpR family, response regulator
MTTRIMVVDDEPVIGKLLIYQLSGFGYQVSYFQDGLEALQQLPTTRPDLVLLDVMMPLISGWEVCRQIRAC